MCLEVEIESCEAGGEELRSMPLGVLRLVDFPRALRPDESSPNLAWPSHVL